MKNFFEILNFFDLDRILTAQNEFLTVIKLQILIYGGVKMYVMAQSAFPCEGRGITNVGDE
jgi:hypothetical protein